MSEALTPEETEVLMQLARLRAEGRTEELKELLAATAAETFPDWVQPTGFHDSYPKGFCVRYRDRLWFSDLSANVWEPGVFGWSKDLSSTAN